MIIGKLSIFITKRSILIYCMAQSAGKRLKVDRKEFDTFNSGCLQKICSIFWPNKISNADLYKKTVDTIYTAVNGNDLHLFRAYYPHFTPV